MSVLADSVLQLSHRSPGWNGAEVTRSLPSLTTRYSEKTIGMGAKSERPEEVAANDH
jgi:hypothetical protein